jgi:hypothetical protein
MTILNKKLHVAVCLVFRWLQFEVQGSGIFLIRVFIYYLWLFKTIFTVLWSPFLFLLLSFVEQISAGLAEKKLIIFYNCVVCIRNVQTYSVRFLMNRDSVRVGENNTNFSQFFNTYSFSVHADCREIGKTGNNTRGIPHT